MTAIYQQMLDADVPEEVVDKVAKMAHKIDFSEVCSAVHNMYSPFERIFRDNDVTGIQTVIETLESEYPDMKIHVDDYFDWITVILQITPTHFVMFHHYSEYGENMYFLAEGDYLDNVFHFDRFFYKYKRSPTKKIITDVDTYFNSDNGCDYIPFQTISSIMGGPHDLKNVQFRKKEKKICTWYKTKDIIRWFLSRDVNRWFVDNFTQDNYVIVGEDVN